MRFRDVSVSTTLRLSRFGDRLGRRIGRDIPQFRFRVQAAALRMTGANAGDRVAATVSRMIVVRMDSDNSQRRISSGIGLIGPLCSINPWSSAALVPLVLRHARCGAISAATKSMSSRARSGGVRPKACRTCRGTRSSCRCGRTISRCSDIMSASTVQRRR